MVFPSARLLQKETRQKTAGGVIYIWQVLAAARDAAEG